jgi:heme-degrading monooxygenase HmoA
MVLEIADFTIKAGTEDEFAAAVKEALPFVAATPGFLGARLSRGIESPSRFVLLIEWESVQAHNVGFRESDRFPKWRALIGPYFDGNPHVEHAVDVLRSS